MHGLGDEKSAERGACCFDGLGAADTLLTVLRLLAVLVVLNVCWWDDIAMVLNLQTESDTCAHP